MKYTALDQNGEPLTGLVIRFFRSGPDDLQDGDGNSIDVTDSNGEAFYTFQGAKAGIAKITAVAYESYNPTTGMGDRLAYGERSDTVTFGATKQTIAAELALKNQKDGDDVAKVNAPKVVAGATISLYKVRKDGSRKLIAETTANAYGNAKFVVADGKPNKARTFKAKVGETSKTFADWTPKRTIK